MRVIAILILILWLAGSGVAEDNKNTPMHFTPLADNGVLAEGNIDSTTVGAFNAYWYDHPTTRRIIFNSNGGVVIEALLLGRAIRKAGLDTYVGGLYRTPSNGYAAGNLLKIEECYSACVYAFAGGVHRFFDSDGGVMGIHQFSSSAVESESNAQLTMTAIGIYLDEMGVSRHLLDWAATIPANSMQPVPRAMAERFRLDNTGRQGAKVRVNAALDDSPRGLSDELHGPPRVMLIRQSTLGFVNVRERPTISSSVVDKAHSGTYTLGRVVSGWYEIRGVGWVAGKYVVYAGRPLSPEQCPQMNIAQREAYGKCR